MFFSAATGLIFRCHSISCTGDRMWRALRNWRLAISHVWKFSTPLVFYPAGIICLPTVVIPVWSLGQSDHPDQYGPPTNLVIWQNFQLCLSSTSLDGFSVLFDDHAGKATLQLLPHNCPPQNFEQMCKFTWVTHKFLPKYVFSMLKTISFPKSAKI